MISRVFMICDSYESGFGHGLQNDGLDLSKTPHGDDECGEAYQLGYDAGKERYKESHPNLASPPPLAQPRAPISDAQIDNIMEAVQEFASTWSLVGSRFDDGSMLELAEAQKKCIRGVLAAPGDAPAQCNDGGQCGVGGYCEKCHAQGDAPSDAINAAVRFAGMVLRMHRNDGYPGDIDGDDLERMALKCGLIESRTVTEPCGETCTCAEVIHAFPTECFFNTDAGSAAIAASTPKDKP